MSRAGRLESVVMQRVCREVLIPQTTAEAVHWTASGAEGLETLWGPVRVILLDDLALGQGVRFVHEGVYDVSDYSKQAYSQLHDAVLSLLTAGQVASDFGVRVGGADGGPTFDASAVPLLESPERAKLRALAALWIRHARSYPECATLD